MLGNKKIFAFLLAMLLTVGSMNAATTDYTAKAFLAIDVDPSSPSNPRLVLCEAANFSNAFENGYDAENANSYGIDVYATISGQTGTNWSVWCTNELDSTKLCVRITEGTDHSIKFASVAGTTLYLYDVQEDVYTEIKDGESYAFTITAAQVGTAITNRFMIVKNLPAPNNVITYTASSKLSETTSTSILSSALRTNAFNTTITSHTFADGVGTITFAEEVTRIGSRAFYGCRSLMSITIPERVTSIGSEAFRACSGLTSITIPTSVTSIGYAAFSGCSSLTSITIPERVTSIGSYAFAYCSSLTSITIPEGVTSIGSGAFGSCPNITSMIVAQGNTKYDSREGCNAIIEMATNTLIAGCRNTIIPESVTSIGDDAFYGCSSLTSITIPERVTSIGSYAFLYCRSLTSITIPEGVTSIGSSAFFGCTSLTSITIPEGVTSIGFQAFDGCSSLTSITCLASVPPTIGDSYTFYIVPQTIPVYVPAESVDAYKAAEGWSEFTNIQAIEEDNWIPDFPQEPGFYEVAVVAEPADGGSVTGDGYYMDGEEAEIVATAAEGYTFIGWSDGETEATRTITMLRDTMLTAYFERNMLDTVIVSDYRMAEDLLIGSITHVIVTETGHLDINTETTAQSLTVYVNNTQAAKVTGLSHLTTESADMVLRLHPTAEQAAKSRWYAFAVPFEVSVNNGIRKEGATVAARNNTDFALMEYDGALRASTQRGWKRIGSTATLQPGRFYMIAVNGTNNTWRLSKKDGSTIEGNATVELYQYPAAQSHHSGWNGIANPLMTEAMSQNGVDYLTIFSNEDNAYKVVSAQDYRFATAEPAFVQVNEDGQMVFGSESDSENRDIASRRQVEALPCERYQLSISDKNNQQKEDHVFLTIGEEKKNQYEIGKDLEKMTNTDVLIPQLWMEVYNHQLAAHEIALDGTELLPLGITAPQAGEYQLTLSERITNAEVMLLHNGTEVYSQNDRNWNIELEKGENSGYMLQITRKQVATDMDEYDALSEPNKVMRNGVLYILKGSHAYSAQGMLINTK